MRIVLRKLECIRTKSGEITEEPYLCVHLDDSDAWITVGPYSLRDGETEDDLFSTDLVGDDITIVLREDDYDPSKWTSGDDKLGGIRLMDPPEDDPTPVDAEYTTPSRPAGGWWTCRGPPATDPRTATTGSTSTSPNCAATRTISPRRPPIASNWCRWRTMGRWGVLDQRAVFLRCYELMTVSMQDAIAADEFDDPVWVARLLDRFAGYYFDALVAYEQDPAGAPLVWRLAHDACLDPDVRPLQRLLLGINAHINYDLALALHELLGRDWAVMGDERRESRLNDYVRVNRVIAATVDQVQDQVVEPIAPVLRILDILLGGADECLASRLLDRWRDGAWEHGVALLGARDADERGGVVAVFEAEAVRTAHLILLGERPAPG